MSTRSNGSRSKASSASAPEPAMTTVCPCYSSIRELTF